MKETGVIGFAVPIEATNPLWRRFRLSDEHSFVTWEEAARQQALPGKSDALDAKTGLERLAGDGRQAISRAAASVAFRRITASRPVVPVDDDCWSPLGSRASVPNWNRWDA